MELLHRTGWGGSLEEGVACWEEGEVKKIGKEEGWERKKERRKEKRQRGGKERERFIFVLQK